jgi:hypothetical protein
VSADPIDFDRPCDPPLEYHEVPPRGPHVLPDEFRGRVSLYTPHDGGAIPHRFRFREDGSPLVDPQVLEQQHVRARDWGANLVASHLAAALGVGGYARCNIARVLLDFNRFPGSTPENTTEPLDRLAIGQLYAQELDHPQKSELLESCYDPISEAMERHLDGKLISIGVHTYDEAHASATKRAHVSLISLPRSYQLEARMTFGVFDPLFPDDLAESTCSRILRDRISLNLERTGFRVVHNHPYFLPDGSIELRAQVWYFFRYLRQAFQAEHPETAEDPAYQLIWTMLLDTNLRLAEAEACRSFLHRFRRVSPKQQERLGPALDAYRAVRQFLQDSDVVTRYRRSADRPSSLGVEVRKDLVCTFDPETGRPRKPTPEQKDTARQIAEAMAGAISTFINTDRAYIVEGGA